MAATDPAAGRPGPRLAEHTTLRLGGPVRRLVVARTDDEVVDLVRDADGRGEPLLVLGGGSNLVVADEGFDGTVVRVATRGVRRSGGTVTAAAGEDWDAFVAGMVADGLAGVEALSGVPGLVGASPIQNVGAYGQDVAQTVSAVQVLDRSSGALRTLSNDECRFTYRHSVFKGDGRYVVLDVTFELAPAATGSPVRYAELARHLGVGIGDRAPLPDVRQAVLDLRRRKGMVLDAADHDTWSVGSFFTNPLLPAVEADRLLPAEAPRWPETDGRLKVSAAWLIERAGFDRGFALHPDSPARISTKHTLALTNRGTASTADLLELAAAIRAGVHERFGVVLAPEPVLVGCALPAL